MIIKEPFVEVLASPKIHDRTLQKYAEYKKLKLVDDPTPFNNIYNTTLDKSQSHGDLIGEFAGRMCYQSWEKGRPREDYMENILESRHGSVLGHANYTLIVAGVSRSLTMELIRHHVGTNPSQLSQRFFNENHANFVVHPAFLDLNDEEYLNELHEEFNDAIRKYSKRQERLKHLPKKQRNEAARGILPNEIETEMVYTGNIRAWRNIIEQRANIHADREIRRLAVAITKVLKPLAPLSFKDLEMFVDEDGHESVKVEFSKV